MKNLNKLIWRCLFIFYKIFLYTPISSRDWLYKFVSLFSLVALNVNSMYVEDVLRNDRWYLAHYLFLFEENTSVYVIIGTVTISKQIIIIINKKLMMLLFFICPIYSLLTLQYVQLIIHYFFPYQFI